MSAASPFDPPASEALALLESPHLGSVGQTRAQSFEFSCRGDRVQMELFAPEGSDAGPALLVQPDPSDPSGVASLPGFATWLTGGVAVASITFPLFGSRRSPKMTAMLEGAIADSAAGRSIDDNARILWQEFTRQAVLELRRAVDVLAELRGPQAPVMFAGAGIAASVGAIFCAVESRLAAGLLAGPGRHGPEGVDPSAHLDTFADSPVQVVERADGAWLDQAWSSLSPHLSP